MSRLIDADALVEQVSSYNPIKYTYEFGEVVTLEDINHAPTIEAEPIRHGHWLFYEEPDGYYHTECSECGQWCDEDVFLKSKWHYCPNCGAKMDEGTTWVIQ